MPMWEATRRRRMIRQGTWIVRLLPMGLSVVVVVVEAHRRVMVIIILGVTQIHLRQDVLRGVNLVDLQVEDRQLVGAIVKRVGIVIGNSSSITLKNTKPSRPMYQLPSVMGLPF